MITFPSQESFEFKLVYQEFPSKIFIIMGRKNIEHGKISWHQ